MFRMILFSICLLLPLLGGASNGLIKLDYGEISAPLAASEEVVLKMIAKSINLPYEKLRISNRKSYVIDQHGISRKASYWKRLKEENKYDLNSTGGTGRPLTYSTDRHGKIWALNLSKTQFKDLKLIGGLTSLQDFSCRNCQISTLSLSGHKSLRGLWLDSNKISEITDFNDLEKLSYISIGDNPIKTLEHMGVLKSLKFIKFLGGNLSDFKWVEKVPNLVGMEYFSMRESNYQIKGIKPLSQLKELQGLHLGTLKAVSDISPIGNLKKLVRLDSTAVPFSSFEQLSGADSLRYIKVRKAKSTSTAGLGSLTKLERVSILNSGLKVISDLDGLNNLISLELYDNDINRLQGINTLSSVRRLDLSGNNISRIENLEGMECLNYLYLNGNPIKEFENLDKLPRLLLVELYGTQVNEIKGWEKLQSMEDIHIEKERLIYDYDGIYHLFPHPEIDRHFSNNLRRHVNGENVVCDS